MAEFRYIPVIFFPPNDRPTFSIELELPNGSPTECTEAVVIDVEKFMKENLSVNSNRKEGITSWGRFIAQSAPPPYAPEIIKPEYAYLLVNATSRQIIEELVPPLEKFCFNQFPDLKATIKPLEIGPPACLSVEVRICGRNTEKLFDIVNQVKEKLSSIAGTRMIDDDWGGDVQRRFLLKSISRVRIGQVLVIRMWRFLSKHF